MPTFEEARNIILQHIVSLPAEPVPLLESLGRVLEEDFAASWDMPPCSNSAMDGYAIRSSDCKVGEPLPIIDYIPAGGYSRKPLEPGTAIKIMTGAPVPEGCDAIVPLEEARESEGGVFVEQHVTVHQHVRMAGEDIRRGELVLPKGTLIQPKDISVLASLGKEKVPVFCKPRVAIVATGDELLELGEIPSDGRIINSNSYFLAAAIKALGATPVMLGIARDNLESHRQLLNEGLNADILITSAGVSVGDRDLVRDVLGELGVEQIFWRVDVKPGKALTFGMKDTTPVFALPGNPVSAMLTFEEFVAPALLKMMGHRNVIRPLFTAELQHEMRKAPGRTHLARVHVEYVDGRYLARSAGKQETGLLKTLLNANAIALLPSERTTFAAGDPIQVHLMNIDLVGVSSN
jgi:molybdopterin molybdotransferase